MPQRYNITAPVAGFNLYQTYPSAAAAGYPSVPGAYAQLGIQPGEKAFGNLNTTWMFVAMANGQASVAAGGTIYANPSSTNPPFQGTGTTVAGGVTGTVLVSVPATPAVPANSLTGVWAEISGAVLNTTMTLMDAPLPYANENTDSPTFKHRLASWLLSQGLNGDGSLMTEEQRAAAEKALFPASSAHAPQATLARAPAPPPAAPHR
jgi:hypothetical protein